MQKMEELREMLCEELEKITKKGELSTGSLDVVDKLTHSIKSIDTIMAMENARYSNESGYSYARGRGRNARRDSMGRYSRESMGNYGGSYENSYARGGNRGGSSERGYSREDAKEELAMELKELKMDTKDPEVAQMIHRWIKQLEQD